MVRYLLFPEVVVVPAPLLSAGRCSLGSLQLVLQVRQQLVSMLQSTLQRAVLVLQPLGGTGALQ